MRIRQKAAAAATILAVCGLVASACGSSSKSSSSATTATGSTGSTSSTTAAASSGPTTTLPTTSASSFTNDFSAMAALKSVAAKGSGSIGVILPDTTSSARYTEFDQPYLEKAFATAGLPASDYKVQNEQGSDAQGLIDAKADITNGAKVLIIDPEDPAGGVAIEKYAAQHGVKTIDYDRLTLGGSRNYYVSFNNVQVGTLIGQGLVSCVASWHVKKPVVVVMHGATTDNNATLFAQGYDAVLKPYFASGKWIDAANTAGTWTPATALTEFQGAFQKNPKINSALLPNDETGAPIISYLQSKGLKPDSFPATGQDATLQGLQNVISGYQCGTAYKPIYEEAQAAVALALYLRAHVPPPSGLVNGTAEDIDEHVAVPSVLLTPEWVTPQNIQSTIIADKFVPASQLCAGKYAADCSKYGIS